jgi:hypothetical protein
MITPYNQEVNKLKQYASEQIVVKTVQFGTLNTLDNNQDIVYPFVHIRPMTSPGLQFDVANQTYTRLLTFEIYSLTIPTLEDDGLLALSETEQILYNIVQRYNSDNSNLTDFAVESIAPAAEAFQDRVYGWVATITMTQFAGGSIDPC